jgi:NAD-dependent DNA ligase
VKILQQTQLFQDMPAQDFDLIALTQLSELLVYHSDLYYNKSQPIISDSEYDSLFKKLQAVEGLLDMRDKFSEKV